MTGLDTESVSWLRVALAFAVVFGLIAAFGFALKRIGAKGLRMPGMAGRASRRMEVVETLPLDVRRRLVIVRCDGEEHLLLLGANHDIVIGNALKKNQKTLPAAKTKE
jgi:flagellar protein FliO/FliZ